MESYQILFIVSVCCVIASFAFFIPGTIFLIQYFRAKKAASASSTSSSVPVSSASSVATSSAAALRSWQPIAETPVDLTQAFSNLATQQFTGADLPALAERLLALRQKYPAFMSSSFQFYPDALTASEKAALRPLQDFVEDHWFAFRRLQCSIDANGVISCKTQSY